MTHRRDAEVYQGTVGAALAANYASINRAVVRG